MPIEMFNSQRSHKINKPQLKEFALGVLKCLELDTSEVTIIFVGDRKMRQLNRDFRGIDKSTDVLSFSYKESNTSEDNNIDEKFYEDLSNFTGNYLGDVVISTKTANIYAQKLGLTFEQEVKTLILHGLLHLAGYDHETDNGEMDELEGKLRKQLLGLEQIPALSVDS
jgi:probable rRNA maturation factor